MCERCDVLKLAIQKGETWLHGRQEDGLTRSERAFVRVLKAELNSVESNPDHMQLAGSER